MRNLFSPKGLEAYLAWHVFEKIIPAPLTIQIMEGPDYTKYSLAELQDAFAHIDRDQFPLRAKTIETEIEKRKQEAEAHETAAGTTQIAAQEKETAGFPRAKKSSNTRFTLRRGLYRTSLILNLTLYGLINSWSLLAAPAVLSGIGLAVQLLLLIAILARLRWQVVLIRIWCWSVVIGGMAGVVATGSTLVWRELGGSPTTLGTLNLRYILESVLRVLLGGFYLRFLSSNLVERNPKA